MVEWEFIEIWIRGSEDVERSGEDGLELGGGREPNGDLC